MTYIKQYLNNLDQLSPIKTELSKKLSSTKRYKAFIFDIYGTLLISSSGDVEEADPTTDNLNEAFIACNIIHTNNSLREKTANQFIDNIHTTIKRHHTIEKDKGNLFPEIVIEDIFEEVLIKHINSGELRGDHSKSNIKKLVFIFELASNKVWPMPGFCDIVSKINSLNKPLGIVSNAQFYTPLIVNHFLNKSYLETESISPFKNDLIQYSYKSRKGKPDNSIFKDLLASLKSNYSIDPEDTVYIGNDMLKDIYTANSCGMDTVLFAGDKRSLRMRKNDDRCKGLKPTHIITELSQLEEIL